MRPKKRIKEAVKDSIKSLSFWENGNTWVTIINGKLSMKASIVWV